MKKNFVQKLALGLALVMTVTSVPATSEAAAKPAFKTASVSVEEGTTVKAVVKKTKNYKVKKVVSKDETIATVSYAQKAKKVNVKVTGVKAGETVVKAVLKKNGKKVKAKLAVEVTAKKEEAPVVVEAALAGITQTAANTFRVTFTADASKKFTKGDFSVVAADSSSVLSVKDVIFAVDGLSADVVVYNVFDNGVTYNVACGGVTVPFTASVGEVSKITIHTASAQENVKTPISFTLYDANGIDVTSSVDLDSYCVITITGSHSGADIDKASEAFLTMNGVGSTADVTIVYNSNKIGATDVTETQKITCVDAQAVIGNKLFVETLNVNNESDCAKFYLGLSDSVISVEENEFTDDVYFCAKGNDGEVISYDSYKVESSNEDVMNVEINGNTDSGKYSRFNVTGNNIGSAQINITAEKNGKITKYTVPVTVTKVNEAVRMDVTVTRPVMSNVIDYEYQGLILPTLYDANGNVVAGTYDYEVVTNTTVGNSLNVTTNATTGMGVVTAQNAVAKTYTVKVTGADNRTGKTFVKNVNITVKALPQDANVLSGAGIKLTYQVELVENTSRGQIATTSFDIVAGKETATLSTRLYATYNGLFAGYVRDNGGIIVGAVNPADTMGTVRVNADTQLDSIDVLARFGNLVFNTTSDLLGSGAVIDTDTDGNGINDYIDTLETIGASWLTYSFIEDKNTDSTIAYGDVVTGTTNRAYSEVARSGSYVLEYNLVYTRDFDKADRNGNGIIDGTETLVPLKKTQSFTMNDKVVSPTVKVESRKIVGATVTSVIDALSTNVDMNNNISNNVSIIDVFAADGTTPVTTNNGTKTTVKYAVVKDNYSLDWNFWVPVNTTFTIE